MKPTQPAACSQATCQCGVGTMAECVAENCAAVQARAAARGVLPASTPPPPVKQCKPGHFCERSARGLGGCVAGFCNPPTGAGVRAVDARLGTGSAAGHTTSEFSNLSNQAHGYGVDSVDGRKP